MFSDLSVAFLIDERGGDGRDGRGGVAGVTSVDETKSESNKVSFWYITILFLKSSKHTNLSISN